MDTAGGTRMHTEAENGSEAPNEIAASKKRPRKTYQGLCPLCGVKKEISHTANRRAVVIAIQADSDTAPLFERHEVNTLDDSFRICKPCSVVALQAISFVRAANISWKDYLDSMMQRKTTKHPAKILPSAIKSQGQPLIALFKSIASGQHTLSLSLPSDAATPAARPENLFTVGDLVNLPRRKQANVNEDGGVAVVLSFRCGQVKGKRSFFYSVKHTVGSRRVENDLAESLLAHYSYNTSKKRRSVDAEAKAIEVLEERELQQLHRENVRLRERVRNLEADATRTELQKVDLRAKCKETKRAASELAQKNEELNSKMSAQYQAMQKNVNDLLAEAKSQAQREAAEAESQAQAVEAALASSREREARIESMRQQENKHAQEVKALKGAVQVATVARYQLESSVESMLKDTAKTVAEGYEGKVADLRAIIDQHEKEVRSRITRRM